MMKATDGNDILSIETILSQHGCIIHLPHRLLTTSHTHSCNPATTGVSYPATTGVIIPRNNGCILRDSTAKCHGGMAALKPNSAASNQAAFLRNTLAFSISRTLNRGATHLFFNGSFLGGFDSFDIHGITILESTRGKCSVSPTHSLESLVRSIITAALVKSTTSTARFPIIINYLIGCSPPPHDNE